MGDGFWRSPEDTADTAAIHAREAVRKALLRAEYEALKLLAWRFRFGAHIVASSVALGEHHALYISSEEVIHREEDTGKVVSDTWITLLLRFSHWRAVAWPGDTAHADEVVRRARARVGDVDGYSLLFGGTSEHFVRECYTGSASSDEAVSKATTFATLATGGASAGAAAAAPFAVSTATVYALGFIPVGTATVVSGGVIAAGAALGAAVGGLVAAPLYWSWRRSARQQSMRRLQFCLVNETGRPLYVRAYRLDDSYCVVPIYGLAGSSEGDIAAGRLLELDPPEDAEEFRVVLSERGSYFTSECLRAVARRGSVYALRGEGPAASPGPGAESAGLTMSRVPRSVLPAYSPT